MNVPAPPPASTVVPAPAPAAAPTTNTVLGMSPAILAVVLIGGAAAWRFFELRREEKKDSDALTQAEADYLSWSEEGM